jgi:uncharacterized protein
MLEIRPVCENCKKDLAYNSTEAYICSFECTYCKDCALDLFQNVCPNCGGGFVQRPVRPKKLIEKYPPVTETVYHPVNMKKHEHLLSKFKNIPPADR